MHRVVRGTSSLSMQQQRAPMAAPAGKVTRTWPTTRAQPQRPREGQVRKKANRACSDAVIRARGGESPAVGAAASGGAQLLAAQGAHE